MQNYYNPDKSISLEEEDPPDEMIGVADPVWVCSD